MAGLTELMRSANFNCENTAELITQAEQTEKAEQEEANDPLGMTPLLLAATLGLLSELKEPLAAGVDANTRYGRDELSLLDAATLMGHPEVVRALLEHEVDVNDASPSGYTALQRAVKYGRADLLADVIDLLLSAGADIDASTDEGSTPLHLASTRPDCGDMTAILLRYGAVKDARWNGTGWSPLHMTAEYGNVAATRALLVAGADVTLRHEVYQHTRKAPLDIAARSGQVEVVRELLRHGVDPNAACDDTGCTAIDHAVRKNHAGAVDALIEGGAHLFATTLEFATENLALEIMATLLRHGAPIRAAVVGGPYPTLDPPLHIAARLGGTEGAAEAVDLLLRWGVDESERCYDGNTPSDVVGVDVDVDTVPTLRLVADADRVRELLANAPADRAWRRRGLLLLCLARNRTTPRKRRRIRSGGAGGAGGEGALAWDGGGGGGGDGAVPSRAGVGASVAVTGRGERERMQSKVGGGDGGGGGSSGCSAVGGGGEVENGVGFDGVVDMLAEFEEEGFFRTIVGFL